MTAQIVTIVAKLGVCMRSTCAAVIFAMSISAGPVLAADGMKLGKDYVVIEGKSAFVNGKKVSCEDLANTIHEDWGNIVFDKNCVRQKIRIVPQYKGFLKAVYTEGQWLYRIVGPDRDPIAIFMDWQYSQVLFRVHCFSYPDISFVYHGDSAVKLKPGDSMTLLLDDRPYRLSVEYFKSSDHLVGRIKLTTALKTAITKAKDINIAAPNEMDEPWYTGEAPALKRLIKECK